MRVAQSTDATAACTRVGMGDGPIGWRTPEQRTTPQSVRALRPASTGRDSGRRARACARTSQTEGCTSAGSAVIVLCPSLCRGETKCPQAAVPSWAYRLQDEQPKDEHRRGEDIRRWVSQRRFAGVRREPVLRRGSIDEHRQSRRVPLGSEAKIELAHLRIAPFEYTPTHRVVVDGSMPERTAARTPRSATPRGCAPAVLISTKDRRLGYAKFASRSPNCLISLIHSVRRAVGAASL